MRTVKAKKISNTEMVANVLRKAGKPLTAYEVLDRLRSSGVSGPPTVYRALEKLIADGRVHRLESMNAFVLCNHTHDSEAMAFAICDDCGDVSEFATAKMTQDIAAWARKAKFDVQLTNFEIHGHCAKCSAR
jgi:Fur family zinc uptake transcriptional regulator